VDSPNSSHTLHNQQSQSYQPARNTGNRRDPEQELEDTPRAVHRECRASSPAGLDSVLKWKVFPQPTPHLALPGTEASPPATQLPNLEYSELARLEAKYIAYVHMKNPILDLEKLHDLISQLTENGLDWSTETCLVSLVCALGALSQEYTPQNSKDANSKFDSGPSFDDETKLASQYWSVAAKRLGFVVGQNSLEAVQCLCLTG
jgi:hypothetical protein